MMKTGVRVGAMVGVVAGLLIQLNGVASSTGMAMLDTPVHGFEAYLGSAALTLVTVIIVGAIGAVIGAAVHILMNMIAEVE
ncbi:hypothetical protein J4211_05305 [Candidatus Woesearchaeota archaeon]|nr:hypothetical protein [Candidatus Woesearchaeota archaeon]